MKASPSPQQHLLQKKPAGHAMQCQVKHLPIIQQLLTVGDGDNHNHTTTFHDHFVQNDSGLQGGCNGDNICCHYQDRDDNDDILTNDERNQTFFHITAKATKSSSNIIDSNTNNNNDDLDNTKNTTLTASVDITGRTVSNALFRLCFQHLYNGPNLNQPIGPTEGVGLNCNGNNYNNNDKKFRHCNTYLSSNTMINLLFLYSGCFFVFNTYQYNSSFQRTSHDYELFLRLFRNE